MGANETADCARRSCAFFPNYPRGLGREMMQSEPQEPGDAENGKMPREAAEQPAVHGKMEFPVPFDVKEEPPTSVDISTIAKTSLALQRLIHRLGDRWSLPILDVLRVKPMRFAKLKKALDQISQRMLTLSLKKLEQDGLIHREELPGAPPQVTYELTALGALLATRLAEFDGWLNACRNNISNANNDTFGRNAEPGED
jgi:DNA-binding HxlR family transcriptional regulator